MKPMMIWIMSSMYVLLGAAAWMLRGGAFWNTGSTQLARLGAALSLSVPISVYMWDPVWLLLILCVWVGVASVSWGDFFDMGSNDSTTAQSKELVSPLLRWLSPTSIWHDLLGMSLTGLVMMAPSVLLYAWMGASWWWLLVPGIMLGPIYWLGWRMTKTHAISVSEGITGALIACCMLIAL